MHISTHLLAPIIRLNLEIWHVGVKFPVEVHLGIRFLYETIHNWTLYLNQSDAIFFILHNTLILLFLSMLHTQILSNNWFNLIGMEIFSIIIWM